MALPLGTTGSLSPTFVPARLVGLTVKLPYAFALEARFPTARREPLGASVTLWEATAPVKLPTWQCPLAGLRLKVRIPATQGWYPKVDSTETGVPVSPSPTYPVRALPKLNAKLE
jgi:hypothetical protein